MEPTKFQELKKIEMKTNRESILWFSKRLSDLTSQIAKK